MKNKRKNIFFEIICGSTILSITCFMIILICILMIFDFFGAKLTKEKIQNNTEYSENYLTIANKYLKNGYVPLQRILYFYLEDTTLTFDSLYELNQDIETKSTKEITIVCEDVRLKNMIACTNTNINDNEEYLIVSTKYFNLPLNTDFTITSFFNQQRIIYDKTDIHNGWDLAVPERTPVYSVCNGLVENINFTQEENTTYDVSGNAIGNTITIKCDEEYDENYYVIYAHLYPNSFKVKEGDRVNHWTEIASVGTTGYSTGNHLHYQVQDKDGNLLDGMKFVDFNLTRTSFISNN